MLHVYVHVSCKVKQIKYTVDDLIDSHGYGFKYK